MSSPAVQSVQPASSSTTLGTVRGLAPLFCIVFLGFTAVAAPLAAVSLHVHDVLGLGGVWVGVSVGLQSIATVLTLFVVPIVYVLMDRLCVKLTGHSSAHGLIRAAEIEKETLTAAGPQPAHAH